MERVRLREGYLVKRAMKSGRNYKRRWVVLSCCGGGGEVKIAWFETRLSQKPNGVLEVPSGSVFRPSSQDRGFELETPSAGTLVARAESDDSFSLWEAAFLSAVSASRGSPPGFIQLRGDFMDGVLFKTPTDARKWEQRYFLLADGVLSFWASPGKDCKGSIPMSEARVLPGKTSAKGAPSGCVFQVLHGERALNLCAKTEVELLGWYKALESWRVLSSPGGGAS